MDLKKVKEMFAVESFAGFVLSDIKEVSPTQVTVYVFVPELNSDVFELNAEYAEIARRRLDKVL